MPVTRRTSCAADPAVHASTYGIPATELAALTGVHLDTARRWKRAGTIPDPHATIIALKLYGDLGQLSLAWKGFALISDQLWTPEGSPITPGQIRAIPFRLHELNELRTALAPPFQRPLL